MTLTSFNFLIFFVLVFIIYYFALKEKKRLQNWLLVFASYVFYGLADYKMIVLLFTATTIFYYLGNLIKSSSQKKSAIFSSLGVVLSIGVLFYFKYFNFFIHSFSTLFNNLGFNINVITLNILIPVGVSFFTFKLISYIIEIRRGKIEPCNNFVDFATYISFFPTILSGPIDRPNDFIPQIQSRREFKYDTVVDGCRQILWGVFQKVVIADNLATVINPIWNDIANQTASTLIFSAILFSIQIYADFSGYSHIAIGLGKILGFRIAKNFNYPYFSRNISEFWRNWHITLTSWLTDYVFIPLNIKFRNFGNFGIILAIIINMSIIGLWHGASWTYLIFGLFHGFLFIPLILNKSIFSKKKLKVNRFGLPIISDLLKILLTFMLVTFSLIIFKADSLEQAYTYFYKIVNVSIFSFPHGFGIVKIPMFFSVVLFSLEWLSRKIEYPLYSMELKTSRIFRYLVYFALILIIFYFGNFGANQFIYFKF